MFEEVIPANNSLIDQPLARVELFSCITPFPVTAQCDAACNATELFIALEPVGALALVNYNLSRAAWGDA
jgi:hypothetical protein